MDEEGKEEVNFVNDIVSDFLGSFYSLSKILIPFVCYDIVSLIQDLQRI